MLESKPLDNQVEGTKIYKIEVDPTIPARELCSSYANILIDKMFQNTNIDPSIRPDTPYIDVPRVDYYKLPGIIATYFKQNSPDTIYPDTDEGKVKQYFDLVLTPELKGVDEIDYPEVLSNKYEEFQEVFPQFKGISVQQAVESIVDGGMKSNIKEFYEHSLIASYVVGQTLFNLPSDHKIFEQLKNELFLPESTTNEDIIREMTGLTLTHDLGKAVNLNIWATNKNVNNEGYTLLQEHVFRGRDVADNLWNKIYEKINIETEESFKIRYKEQHPDEDIDLDLLLNSIKIFEQNGDPFAMHEQIDFQTKEAAKKIYREVKAEVEKVHNIQNIRNIRGLVRDINLNHHATNPLDLKRYPTVNLETVPFYDHLIGFADRMAAGTANYISKSIGGEKVRGYKVAQGGIKNADTIQRESVVDLYKFARNHIKQEPRVMKNFASIISDFYKSANEISNPQTPDNEIAPYLTDDELSKLSSRDVELLLDRIEPDSLICPNFFNNQLNAYKIVSYSLNKVFITSKNLNEVKTMQGHVTNFIERNNLKIISGGLVDNIMNMTPDPLPPQEN